MAGLMFPAALVYGCLAWFGAMLSVRVCRDIARLPDGPPAGKPPVMWLIAGAAAIGAALALHSVPAFQLLAAGLICMVLVAAWCSDVAYGIVPDAFTVVPLAALLALAIATKSWWLIASALVPVFPFGLAAVASKGRGMGWGDVKLVALGGALLGMQVAVGAFALACLVAVSVYKLRGVQAGPIAFAPYLAAAIGLGLAFTG